MPYFNKDNVNILLIHIPKTGGTSLEKYFSKKYSIPLNNESLNLFMDKTTQTKNNINVNSSLQHMTYQTIIKYKEFFNIKFNNINILTIVRNPYERILSDLFFLGRIHINTPPHIVFDIIKNYLSATNVDNHNLPQYVFITNETKELIPNITILNTETLTNDMIKLGYTDFNNRDNCRSKKDYYSYLNNDSIKLINNYYDYDFTLFNYKKIIPS